MAAAVAGNHPLDPLSETSTLANSEQDFATTSAEKGINQRTPSSTHVARSLNGWRWFALCFPMYMTSFMYGLEITVATSIQLNIVESLGEVQKLAWLGVAFPLGSLVVVLPLGFAYGLFEMKTLFIASVVLFEGGTALCGGAPSMNAEIVGRVLSGVGGAGMYLGTLNFISVYTTLKERATYNALIGVFWGIGCICGPVIGGGFVETSLGWRWAFYINLFIGVGLAPFIILFLPSHQPAPHETFMAKIKSVDWLGAVLIAATQTTYTLALLFGGVQWPWGSYKFAITVSFFGLCLVGFSLSQYFHPFVKKSRRIFACQYLKSRTMVLLNVTTAAGTATMFVAAYYIPFYFQIVHGDSAIKSAVRLLPFLAISIFFYLINGFLMPIFGYYQPWFLVAGIFQIVGAVLWYTTVDAHTSPAKIYGYSVLLAVGCCANQAGYVIAAAKATAKDARQLPGAIAFINVAQIGAIVIVLAMAGCVFQNYAYDHVRQSVGLFKGEYTDQQIRSALVGMMAQIFNEWSAEEKEAVLMALLKATNNIFILVMVAGAVILVSGVLMKREKLFMPHLTGV